MVRAPRRSSNRGGQEICLTERGRRWLHDGANRFEVVDSGWSRRFGADASDALRRAVEDLVGVLPLELAHYPMPYGPADERVTGGDAVVAQPGAVPIPAHGRDWPVVQRAISGVEPGTPLSALLAQALIAFAIDYEIRTDAWRTGNSMSVTTLSSLLSPDGVAADLIPTTRAVRSLVQDGLVTVESDSATPGTKRLRLTPDGERFQASNLARLDDVEREWHTADLSSRIEMLRRAATTVVDTLEPGIPDQLLIVFVGGKGFIDITQTSRSARRSRSRERSRFLTFDSRFASSPGVVTPLLSVQAHSIVAPPAAATRRSIGATAFAAIEFLAEGR